MKFQPLRFRSFMQCATALLCSSVSLSTFAQKEVSVDVDLSQVITQQNPLYYGGNNIYPKGGQGILLPNGEFDPIEMNAAAKLGLQAYRFPGGSEANLYKWKRAIGPVAQRIDNVSGNNRGNQSNEFGPDEFGRMLETTNFKHGFIMIAWGYETPEDAADWVEYMNAEVGENPNGGKDWAAERAKNGHPKPYGIKYWEIGNEVFGNWELNWGSYPFELDGKRGKANVEKDTASGTNGILPFGDASRYIFGGYKYFKQQKAAALSTWKGNAIKTSGQPNQKLYVKFAPVDLSDTSQPFKLEINQTVWHRVDNFDRSTSRDKHFVLNSKLGEIQFGDGVRGKIPKQGQFVIVDYLSGKQPGFVDYYHQMKAVDPSIKVISSFEKPSFFEQMAKAKQPFDGITKHYYPNLLKQGHLYYEAALLSGIDIGKKVDEMMGWYDTYKNPALSGDEQVWLTEYGLKNHVNQLAIMHTIINNHSDQVATLLGHSLFLNNNTPMVNDRGIIRPHALPIEMFSKHMQKNFVKVEVNGDKSAFKKRRFPSMLASASVSDDQQQVGLILTNTTDKARTIANVNIVGFRHKKPMQAEVWALMPTTENTLADNTKNNPNAIVLEKIAVMNKANTNMEITVEPGSSFIIKWSVI